MPGWRDLSDDELGARLRRRGLDDARTVWLVQHRDELTAIEALEEILGG